MPGLAFGGHQFTNYCINILLGELIAKVGGEDVVAYLLKARIVEPAETPIAREQLCKHVHCQAVAAAVLMLYSEDQLPV
jgi:hypothetical protein